MKKILLIFISSLITALIVGVISYFYLDADMKGSLVQWQKLPDPPERILKLSGVEEWGAPYIETVTGKVYSPNLYACFSFPERCWEISNNKEKIIAPRINNCWYKFNINLAPPNILQRFDNCMGSSGGVAQVNTVLLADNSIWIWQKTIYDLSPLLLYLYLAVCIFIGLIVGGIISTAFLTRRKR